MSDNNQAKADYIDYAASQPDPEGEVSNVRSLLGAFPKAAIGEAGIEIRKALNLFPRLLGLGKEFEGTLKSEEEEQEQLKKIFPTKERLAEKTLQRGGRTLPYMLLGAEGAVEPIVRSAVSGLAGQLTEETGGSPTSQSIAETLGAGAPGFKKKIIPTKEQEPLVQGARKLNLTEEQIAPLIQSEKKQKFITPFAQKRGRSQQALKGSKQALGNVYENLKVRPESLQPLSQNDHLKFMADLRKEALNLPAASRKMIAGDVKDLVSQPFTGSSLINFYQDLNYHIGNGEYNLGILKAPIQRAMDRISPELGEDFRLVNRLYSNYSTIASKMRPNLINDLWTLGEAGRLVIGLTTGNYMALAEAIGEEGARHLATEMLINPRLQNLGKQMVAALNQNKISVAKSLFEAYNKELREKGIESGDLLSEENLAEIFKKEKSAPK